MKKTSWLGRTVLNAVLGLIGLVAVNMSGLGLGVTVVNIAVTAVLGIPGLALLMGVRWLF